MLAHRGIVVVWKRDFCKVLCFDFGFVAEVVFVSFWPFFSNTVSFSLKVKHTSPNDVAFYMYLWCILVIWQRLRQLYFNGLKGMHKASWSEGHSRCSIKLVGELWVSVNFWIYWDK